MIIVIVLFPAGARQERLGHRPQVSAEDPRPWKARYVA